VINTQGEPQVEFLNLYDAAFACAACVLQVHSAALSAALDVALLLLT
jgi:hypothetical protein